MGMIAKDVDDSIIKWVLEIVLNPPIKNRKLIKHEPLCTYKTKYNLVRFLERMHPSAPQPYFDEVMNCFKNREAIENKKAWAIRGFHEKEPRVKMAYLWFRKFVTHNLQEYVSDCLLSVLESLAEPELHRDAEFLKINCTFALIRWACDSHKERIKTLIGNGIVSDKSVQNLKQAMCIMHKLQNRKTIV